jgi:hypothetical protein
MILMCRFRVVIEMIDDDRLPVRRQMDIQLEEQRHNRARRWRVRGETKQDVSFGVYEIQ